MFVWTILLNRQWSMRGKFYVNHFKTYIKRALKSALNGWIVSILSDSSKIRISFEGAMIPVATATKRLNIWVGKGIDTAVMAFIAWFGAKIVKRQMEKSVKTLVYTLLSPKPSSSVSSSGTLSNTCNGERSCEKSSRFRTSIFSSTEHTCSLNGSMSRATNSSKNVYDEQWCQNRTLKVKVLHAIDSNFWNVCKFSTIRVFKKLQICDLKMAARLSKYSKRMETLMIFCKFYVKGRIAVLSFIAHFKRVYNSNGVSESRYYLLCLHSWNVDQHPA